MGPIRTTSLVHWSLGTKDCLSSIDKSLFCRNFLMFGSHTTGYSWGKSQETSSITGVIMLAISYIHEITIRDRSCVIPSVLNAIKRCDIWAVFPSGTRSFISIHVQLSFPYTISIGVARLKSYLGRFSPFIFFCICCNALLKSFNDEKEYVMLGIYMG